MKKKVTVKSLQSIIRKLKKENKYLKMDVQEWKSNYEHLWKMRIQDEMERKK